MRDHHEQEIDHVLQALGRAAAGTRVGAPYSPPARGVPHHRGGEAEDIVGVGTLDRRRPDVAASRSRAVERPALASTAGPGSRTGCCCSACSCESRPGGRGTDRCTESLARTPPGSPGCPLLKCSLPARAAKPRARRLAEHACAAGAGDPTGAAAVNRRPRRPSGGCRPAEPGHPGARRAAARGGVHPTFPIPNPTGDLPC